MHDVVDEGCFIRADETRRPAPRSNKRANDDTSTGAPVLARTPLCANILLEDACPCARCEVAFDMARSFALSASRRL